MRTQDALRNLLAIVLAVLFLVGRWDLERLIVDPNTIDVEFVVERSVATVLIQPRLWLVIAGMILVSLIEMGASDRTYAHAGHVKARNSVRIFFVLGCYLILTTAWTPDDNPFPAVIDICLIMLTLLVVEHAARHERFVEVFWLWLERLLLAIGAFALVSQLLHTASPDRPGRLTVLGGGPNILGRFLGMLCLLMIAQSFRQGAGLRWSVVWRIVVAALALILLLETGSRGAFVGMSIGLMTLLLVRRMNVRMIGIGAILLLSFDYLFKLVLKGGVIQSIEDRWLVTTLQEGYLSERDVLFAEGYKSWLQHPVFGGGLDSFNYYTFGLDRYPHNLVLEMAQEGGVVAAFVLLAWIVHLVLASRPWRNHYIEIGISMTALIFACNMFSGDLYDARLMFIFGVLTTSAADIITSRRIPSGIEDQDRDLDLLGIASSGARADEG